MMFIHQNVQLVLFRGHIKGGDGSDRILLGPYFLYQKMLAFYQACALSRRRER